MQSALIRLAPYLLYFWHVEQKYLKSKRFGLQLLPLIYLLAGAIAMGIIRHRK